MLRSRHTLPLAIIAVVIGGICIAVALLIDWVPLVASEQGDRVDDLLWFVIWASIAIFTLVATVLIYSVFAFKVKPGDESDGPPVHGNTKLEIIWTIVPTLLLAVMAVWAYIVLVDNEALASDRVVVNVTAQQFAWEYQYPDGSVGTGDLHLPVDRQVELRMRSRDVIHDFYVKEFHVKQDVVPGITTTLIINPTRTGTYQVICAELCGVGHGVMRSRVIVQTQQEYDAWLAAAQKQVAALAQQSGGNPSSGGNAAPAASGQGADPGGTGSGGTTTTGGATEGGQ
ncbi:MAG TPA: cytochrome c oxidase subunit II [Miltoncostaeaceae bacterium]|nr:cytochrome c oxidase subunit II [Miltoncostaeaceae bacterium]